MLFNGDEISQNWPFRWRGGGPDPYLIRGCWGPPHPTRQTPSRWSLPFFRHLVCPYALLGTNEEVLKRVGETRSMLGIIHRWKCRWIWHILRHDGFLHDIIKGNMVGRATRGRSRIDLLHDIVKVGTYGQLKEKALDRTVWKRGLIEDVPWTCW